MKPWEQELQYLFTGSLESAKYRLSHKKLRDEPKEKPCVDDLSGDIFLVPWRTQYNLECINEIALCSVKTGVVCLAQTSVPHLPTWGLA